MEYADQDYTHKCVIGDNKEGNREELRSIINFQGVELEIVGEEFGADDGRLVVTIRLVGAAHSVTDGVCRELQGMLQDEADEIYQEWGDASFEECCTELRKRAADWLYWRCGFGIHDNEPEWQ